MVEIWGFVVWFFFVGEIVDDFKFVGLVEDCVYV